MQAIRANVHVEVLRSQLMSIRQEKAKRCGSGEVKIQRLNGLRRL
jgi:hypothetical protein